MREKLEVIFEFQAEIVFFKVFFRGCNIYLCNIFLISAYETESLSDSKSISTITIRMA